MIKQEYQITNGIIEWKKIDTPTSNQSKYFISGTFKHSSNQITIYNIRVRNYINKFGNQSLFVSLPSQKTNKINPTTAKIKYFQVVSLDDITKQQILDKYLLFTKSLGIV